VIFAYNYKVVFSCIISGVCVMLLLILRCLCYASINMSI
jgi:hypothetical protein